MNDAFAKQCNQNTGVLGMSHDCVDPARCKPFGTPRAIHLAPSFDHEQNTDQINRVAEHHFNGRAPRTVTEQRRPEMARVAGQRKVETEYACQQIDGEREAVHLRIERR